MFEYHSVALYLRLPKSVVRPTEKLAFTIRCVYSGCTLNLISLVFLQGFSFLDSV